MAQSSAAISSTNPAPLTGLNLNNATITVALTGTTFTSGVAASSFELTPAVSGLSIASVSSVSSGDTTATLTLAFTGQLSSPRTIAIKVLAAAHAGNADLTTGSVSVSVATRGSARISSTNPATLTNMNLNNTTITIALSDTTFGDRVTASDFSLSPAIEGLSISSLSGVTSGGTTATLTLSFSGTFSEAREFAVRLKASAHAGRTDLATQTIRVAVEDRMQPVELDVNIATEVARGLTTSVAGAISGRISSVAGGIAGAAPSSGNISQILNVLANHERDRDINPNRNTASLMSKLDGSFFTHSLAAEGGTESGDNDSDLNGAALWGSVDYQKMSSGMKSSANWTGSLSSVHIGVDSGLDSGRLAGVAGSVSRGSFDYTPSESSSEQGMIKTRMNALYLYTGGMVSEKLSLWAMAGYGRGELENIDSSSSKSASDTSMSSAAFGGNYDLITIEIPDIGNRLKYSLKGDAWGTRFKIAARAAQATDDKINLSGARLAFAGLLECVLECENYWTPFAELGVRWDGGDGKTDFGSESEVGFKYRNAQTGLNINANARTLLSHESGRKQWGAGLVLRQVLGTRNTGASYSLSLEHGNSESNISSLWERNVSGRLDETSERATQFDSEIGYGFFGEYGLYKPYAGIGLINHTRSHRFGIRMSNESAVEYDLEFERRNNHAKPIDNRLMLTGQIDW